MHDSTDDQARIAAAQAAQEQMLAALPDFPRFGYYVHTGLAGYGPDLEPDDYPARNWEGVASQVAWELRSAAEFNHEGATAEAGQARATYQYASYSQDTRETADWRAIAEQYHEAWADLALSWNLDNLAADFENLADADNPALLYEGRPELRHARIWDLLGRFPYDISHNSRLYVRECEEDPGEQE
jgi:hypothetical protein